MQKSVPSINLLRTQEKDFLTRFFEWAMVGGRFIIIITESIALMMFLYRFSLDQQLVDLHDSIRQNGAILDGYKSQEAAFRDIQARLDLAKKNIASGDITQTLITNIITTGKGLVTFKQFQFNGKSVQLDATSNSIISMNSFINALKLLPDVQTVNITSIENKASAGSINVSITADLKT